MSEYEDDIAIMFPANWPETDEFEAHCTLIYLGNVSDAKYTKEDVQSALDRLNIGAPGEVETDSLEAFGPEENILVLTLKKDRLQPIRDSLERTLAKVGAENASEYKDYKPHVTVDYELGVSLEEAKTLMGDLPETVKLGAPELWWGDGR